MVAADAPANREVVISARREAFALAVSTLLTMSIGLGEVAAQDARSLVQEAKQAAPEEIAAKATIEDWEGNVLQEGTNGYTCYPTPPDLPVDAPMCMDGPWQNWLEAYQNQTDPQIDRVGIAYMLGGDAGASNSRPYVNDPEAVDDWVNAPRHLMVLFPDESMYDAFPTDPGAGRPWVMWKGTPYVHVMVPMSDVEYEGESEG